MRNDTRMMYVNAAKEYDHTCDMYNNARESARKATKECRDNYSEENQKKMRQACAYRDQIESNMIIAKRKMVDFECFIN